MNSHPEKASHLKSHRMQKISGGAMGTDGMPQIFNLERRSLFHGYTGICLKFFLLFDIAGGMLHPHIEKTCTFEDLQTT